MTTQTLATGAALTPESFNDFIQRLLHHCVGEGVNNHHTANALFIVQARRELAGIDRDYTDQWLVYCDDQTWHSPQAYWDDSDEESQAMLNAKAQEESEVDFLQLSESDQWEILGNLDDHTVTGWDEQWEYVNAHFTKEAAEAFIKRKAHDYRKGLRVYVEAQLYCWEFNAIKEALLSGQLVLKPEAQVGEQDVCTWHQEDDDGCWHSSCGVHFSLNEGTPSENQMKFCHHCGKPLAEAPFTDDEHEGAHDA